MADYRPLGYDAASLCLKELAAADTLKVPSLKVTGLPSAATLGTDADGNLIAASGGVTVTPSCACTGAGSLFVNSSGELWGCGYIGANTYFNSWTRIQSGGVKACAMGYFSAYYITTDGDLYGIGYNNYGQLGLGHTTTQSAWVLTRSGVSAVWAGDYHTMCLTSGGELLVVGCNMYGQLGLGDTTNRTAWTHAANNVLTAACGSSHSFYITSANVLMACGYNNYCQTGLSGTTNKTTWTQSATGVSLVAAGQYHSLYVNTSSVLYAVGDNVYGALVQGNTTNKTAWTQCAPDGNAITGVIKVAAGIFHTVYQCGASGSPKYAIYAVGDNSSGQLGVGTTTASYTSPVRAARGFVAFCAYPSGSVTLGVGACGLYGCGRNDTTYNNLGGVSPDELVKTFTLLCLA